MGWWRSKQVNEFFARAAEQKKRSYARGDRQIKPLTADLTENRRLIEERIGDSSDVVFRPFHLGNTDQQALIVYVDGMSDTKLIEESILQPLMMNIHAIEGQKVDSASFTTSTYFHNHVIPIIDVLEVVDVNNVIEHVVIGYTALLIDGEACCMLFGTKEIQGRNVDEPDTESVVRGPRVGFVESLRTNMTLLRQQITDPNFTFLSYQIGERNTKSVVVAYVKGIVDINLLEEVQQRLSRIRIDDVLESGYIEQLIEDDHFSPFPQVQNTERPDRVVAALLEGRVAIMVDGTPFVLLVPVTLNMLLQSPEDYYTRWLPASLMRFLRYFAAFAALFVPAIYISFVSFHQGLIPTKLAIAMASSRLGVPFPSLLEALIMEITIEILREAGLRLPKPVGQTVGLVGGLVIGQAAVQAGIVSPVMVIVVSLTAICSFAIPQYDAGIALRILRFGAMFFAAVFGLYGVIMFFLFIAIHLVKLKSFGVPYTAPIVPYDVSDWKDTVIRLPFFKMKFRPEILRVEDKVRRGKR
ncbi:UNVERIFIED_CONTAM: spore germination protein [Brevibacillus sp. OAP136]